VAHVGEEAALREPFVLGQHEVRIGCSIGISLYPNDGDDIETLLRAADAAMYQAKQNGRNRCQRYTAPLDAGAQNCQR
jgi:diguanylate cyclase (GGDEF)-like protein